LKSFGRIAQSKYYRCNGAEEIQITFKILLEILLNWPKKTKLDPVIGRDNEINSHHADTFSAEQKINPILIGEAGTGKTAVVEGPRANDCKE